MRCPAVPTAPEPSPAIEARHTSTCGSGSVTDPMTQMRAKAEHDLLIDFWTATKHASASGISQSELLEQDAMTTHRILQGYARPADERHWRTKEVPPGMVAVSG